MAPWASPGDVRLFTQLLRAADLAPGPHWLPPEQRARVVFLHGWLQDSSSWTTTAHRVRERWGHDCLLLDFPAHGRSPTPADPLISATTLVQLLRQLLVRVCWTAGDGEQVVLCACSMGGAVAMRYTTAFPEDVERLVLVAPAGFDEPWYRASHVGPRLHSTLGRAVPQRLATLLALVRNTPRYDNEPDWFATAAAAKPILLVCAAYDELHRADRWIGGRAADPAFRVRTVPVVHPVICMRLAQLRLDLDPAAWHASCAQAGKASEVVASAADGDGVGCRCQHDEALGPMAGPRPAGRLASRL